MKPFHLKVQVRVCGYWGPEIVMQKRPILAMQVKEVAPLS